MSVENKDKDSKPTESVGSTYTVDQAILSEEERIAIASLNANKKFPKGSILRKEGEISDKAFYLLSGCVRQYRLVDGEELTTFFYTDESSVYASINSSIESSTHFLECTEDCEIAVTTTEQQSEMYKKFPRFEKLCRENSEKDLELLQSIFSKYISSTPEERYLSILQERPTLLHRVPQYQLASYIGVKPESLSRIRKRLSKK